VYVCTVKNFVKR